MFINFSLSGGFVWREDETIITDVSPSSSGAPLRSAV